MLPKYMYLLFVSTAISALLHKVNSNPNQKSKNCRDVKGTIENNKEGIVGRTAVLASNVQINNQC